MPYHFKPKEELTPEERARMGAYLIEIEREYFGRINDSERDAAYFITDKIINFSIYKGNTALEYSIGFKVDDNGNIIEIENNEFNVESLDISDDLKNRISDTLKNIVVESQEGGRKRKNKKRVYKSNKTKKSKKSQKYVTRRRR